MPSPPDSPSTFPRLVGRAVERVEDAALLTGRGRFADDVGERPGTAHAAVLRSPHAHAEIVSLDATAALSMPEVVTVLTGAEVAAWSRPFIAGVKQPMRHYALAVDRVRYTGEPVAVVVARDRYGAEDALERIEVEYRELAPVVDAVAAAAPGAPLLHRDVGSNVVSDRRLRYGDPDAAFASAAHRVAISVRYPRNACTPIEGFVVVAEHLGDDGYEPASARSMFRRTNGPRHATCGMATGSMSSSTAPRPGPAWSGSATRLAGSWPRRRGASSSPAPRSCPQLRMSRAHEGLSRRREWQRCTGSGPDHGWYSGRRLANTRQFRDRSGPASRRREPMKPGKSTNRRPMEPACDPDLAGAEAAMRRAAGSMCRRAGENDAPVAPGENGRIFRVVADRDSLVRGDGGSRSGTGRERCHDAG